MTIDENKSTLMNEESIDISKMMGSQTINDSEEKENNADLVKLNLSEIT